MTNLSNRDIQRLYDQFNPNNIKTGDRVLVSLGDRSFPARIVGLDLDLKNKKLFANLKLLDTSKRNPIRVDAADCTVSSGAMYAGHHNNG